MSALHRLKAYFGMVPAEEFDAAAFDPMECDPAEYGDYHPGYPDPGNHSQGYDSGYDSRFNDSRFNDSRFNDSRFDRATANTPAGSASGQREHARERVRHPHRIAFDDYDDGFATRTGDHVASGTQVTRSASWAAGSRVAGSRAADSWTAEAAVRGSLAIDPSTINAAHTNARSPGRQPAAPQRVTSTPRTGSLTEDPLLEGCAHPLARIVTLHPHNYNEARPIGERYREGNPVIMNLTEMADRDAKRLVDFAAGLAFALRGSIDKVTNKVFLLSPPNVDVSAEDRRRIAEGRFFN